MPTQPASPGWKVNKSIIAGGGAALCSSVATCPLDVIKTKMQASKGQLGVFGTIKHVAKHEGFRGFYRGLGPTLLGYLPTWAIYFAVYDSVKHRLGESLDHPRHGLGSDARVNLTSPLVHILSAMLAGASSTVCTNPIWVVKTRFMTQGLDERRYRHTLDAFVTIYRAEGIRAFYRGLFPSLLGVSHVAVQFPLYERLKSWAGASAPDQPLTSRQILLCSSISKMTASIATYPHEVVRTRLQIRKLLVPSFTAPDLSQSPHSGHHHKHPGYRGLLQTATKIVREEGWYGLYRGLSVNLLRTVPNSAVTLLTYETLMRYLMKDSIPSR